MEEIKQAGKEFLKGNTTINELREVKGLKPVDGGDILITGERRRVFYLCNGEVPYCKKNMCYKNKNAEDDVCRYTTNVAYALNFQKADKCISYFEKTSSENCGAKKEDS